MMTRRLAEWCVDHARLTVALTLAAAAVALVFSLRLKLDALPDLTNNQVLVLTRAPGMTPEEVELRVTRPLEIALGGAPGLLEQRSLSRYGISSVTLVFDDDVSPWLARQVVTERIGGVELPPEATRPELGPLTGGLGEVFHLTLSSPRRTPAELLELGTYRVAPLLKAVPGVVEVNSWGGAVRTLDVRADPQRLSARGLTVQSLRSSLERATGAVPAGALSSQDRQVLVRGVARPLDAVELGHTLAAPGGLRTVDVAEVVEGALPRLGAATANGQGETLYLMVQMLRDANALDVIGQLHRTLPAVKAALPDDVLVSIVYDRSELVGGTLRTVGRSLGEGLLLVLVVLLAFLGNFRAGMVVAAVIPLAMVFATAAMSALGIPGNLMSLGALDFGLLGEGAVVMVESIFHAPPAATMRERVRDATGRNARPVLFAVLVVLLVYVPILSLAGVDGKLFRPMAMTVVFALAAALALSLTFVPAAASLWLRERDVPARDSALVRGVTALVGWASALAARLRPFTLASGVVVLVGGVLAVWRLGVEFTPQLDEGDFVIQTTRAADLSLSAAVAEAGQLERVLRTQVPEVRQVVSRIGSPAVATDIMGLEQADVFVRLAPKDAWRPGLTRDGLAAQMDAVLTAQAPGGNPSFTQPIQMRFNELLGGAVTDVAVSIYGDDLGQLGALADGVAGAVSPIEGAKDVRVLAPPAVPLATVRPRTLEAAAAGLTPADVLEAVQATQVGLEVGATYDGLVRVPLRLLLDGAADAWALPALPLPTPGGGLTPLSRVADIERVSTPSMVNRRNGERRLVVGFNVRGQDLGTVVARARAEVEARVPMPHGYRLEWGGQYESLQEATHRLAVVVPVVLLLILVLLAQTFRHARPAAIVYAHVPFAWVGGAWALWLRGLPISLPAVVGFIALSGIAVMSGVVLMTEIRALQASGLTPGEASLAAAVRRARPIVMTALVAALGLLPMMLAHGIGAEVQRPLATVVVGGLFTSTVLTLVMLPALYPLFAGRKLEPE